jgi:colanic acid/amylovoran biosynthesis glycosyltransferase
MIKVAHVMFSYLSQPETFIWQYIYNFKNFYPIIIAKRKENLDQFPIPKGKLYLTYGRRLSYLWFKDNLFRRVFKRPLVYAEQIMRREGVQAIHAHYGPVGCEYLPIIKSLKIPLITSFYGFDLSITHVIKNNEKNYRVLFEKGSRFLVEGPCMRKKLISIGCPKEKISIQKISLTLENYKLKSYPIQTTSPIKILFVGRFVEKKGLEYAFRALAGVKKEFAFEFRVVGAGEMENQLKQIAFNLGLFQKTKWLGMQPHSQVIRELYNCDFLLQPSVTAKNGDTEGGAPTIILEAQACGVPIVSTYHADIPYITIENETAFLANERDVEGLCSHIRYLVNNKNIWEKMGKNGKKYIERHHDIKKQILNLENIYKKCITKNKMYEKKSSN